MRPNPAAALGCLLLQLSCLSCGSPDPGRDGVVSLVSYNVMALFDARDDGLEYPGYSVAKGEWGEERYAARLGLLARAVEEAVPGGPDLLVLVELENAGTLADLASRVGRGYGWLAVAPDDGCSIRVGLGSRFPVTGVRAHAYGDPPAGHPRRSLLEVAVDAGGVPLTILAAHWKSRSEGAEATEPERVAAAALARRVVEDLLAADPDAAIVLAGDFNENPDEWDRVGRRYPTAFMPAGAGRGLALAGGTEPGDGTLWDPWTTAGEGFSYAFRGRAERIDNTLLSPGLASGRSGLAFRSFRAAPPSFATDAAGLPIAWDSRKGAGCSDHFPLALELALEGGR